MQVGEGRACWSLGNAHSAMGDPEKAYHYASRHLEISKETGDRMGQATAQVQYTGITSRGETNIIQVQVIILVLETVYYTYSWA